MDNQGTWHSIKSLEKELQIPNTTLRRYIRQHGHHLNIKKNGKSYLVANESIPLLKKIRGLYVEGKSIENIETILTNEG
ncbi:MerR family transcriptional regulator, partial [Bacillus pumilus]